MFNAAAIQAINFYQRYLSPHKGFCCAYRAHTGHASCSQYAKEVIRRLGVGALWVAMPRQFDRCRSAYAAIRANGLDNNQSKRRQKRRSDSYDRNLCDCSGADCGVCDIDFCSVMGRKAKNIASDSPLDCDVGGCDLPCDCSF